MKPIILEELTSPGCHSCRAFETWWPDEAKNWPNVEVRKRDILTPEGQALASAHMIMASPGVVLNGQLFSTGGVNRQSLVARLGELSKE